MVERQDVCHGFIDIFGLIEQCLAMKSRQILVEVDHEKVQAPSPGLETLFVVSDHIGIMSRGFGSQGSDLAIAAGVSGEEEDGDAV